MEAFVGKFERTSADKYEEMLKVRITINYIIDIITYERLNLSYPHIRNWK